MIVKCCRKILIVEGEIYMNERTMSDKSIKKPKMIIFDYGHTLLYEPNHSPENGDRKLYSYIKSNPNNISFEEFSKTISDMFAKMKEFSGPYLEIHEHIFLKTVLEYMDIELSIPIEEAERVVWYGISAGEKMPYVDELLESLNKMGIRTAVISNIVFSEAALKERLNHFLPDNKFEFVLASSEYIFSKPDPLMFKIALKKAGLSEDEVWYCGDSITSDVRGAQNAGIFPVLYNGETTEENDPLKKINDGLEIEGEHLYIEDWRELISILEK